MGKWLRRIVERSIGTLAYLAIGMLPACDTDTESVTNYARSTDAGADAGGSVPLEDTDLVTYDLHDADRRKCSVFGPGNTTVDSVGPDVPHGSAIPFKHVVFLIQENRSFDHYLSELNTVGGMSDVDVATEVNANPSGSGDPIPLVHRYHETKPCDPNGMDLNHEWEAVHLQYDDGRLDGFVATNDPEGQRAMGYYGASDIPYYYWLAETFGVGDRHFSSLLGPTWPNRYFALAGTSAGCTYTPASSQQQAWCETYPKRNLFDLLADKHVSFGIYSGSGKPFCVAGNCLNPSLAAVMFQNVSNILFATSPIESFLTDAKANRLPQVAFLEPHFDHDSEHPPHDIRRGEALVRQIVEAIGSRDDVWQSTVLFVTHDEHGGYYDHVVPPPACEPDDARPATYAFDRLGFRVPLFVVSAYNKPGYVSHFITDHTSILRFIENLFDLGALTRRDANAWPLLDRFDFGHMAFPSLPTSAPPPGDLPDAGCPE